MTQFKAINQIENKLKELTGCKHDLRSSDFIIPTENQNALIIKEQGNDADLAVCLQKDILERLGERDFPNDFSFKLLPDLSVVVEELSHFNYYCENALLDQSLSELELEVQGEVDKFAYALECLHLKNAQDLKDQLFEVMFGELTLGGWVDESEVQRYYEAHQIARQFCRHVLDQKDRVDNWHRGFKEFYQRSGAEKLSTKF